MDVLSCGGQHTVKVITNVLGGEKSRAVRTVYGKVI